MTRHAMLVVTFGSANVHSRLVGLLDDPDIDFFVHVDRRTPIAPYREVRDSLEHSHYRFASRRRAPNWGSHRFVRVQLELLEQARSIGYDRYHLVSGVDMPLVTASGLKQFFDIHPSDEYVGFSERNSVERLEVYYLLQSWMNRGKQSARVLSAVQTQLVRLQRRLGVNRLRRLGPTAKGSTWFSITDDFAAFVLGHRHFVRSLTRFGLVADEAWLQTLLSRSHFAGHRDPERVGRPDDQQALRLIDWSRSPGPSPHVWGDADLPQLLSSDCLFARKFDPTNTALLDALAARVRSAPVSPHRTRVSATRRSLPAAR